MFEIKINIVKSCVGLVLAGLVPVSAFAQQIPAPLAGTWQLTRVRSGDLSIPADPSDSIRIGKDGSLRVGTCSGAKIRGKGSSSEGLVRIAGMARCRSSNETVLPTQLSARRYRYKLKANSLELRRVIRNCNHPLRGNCKEQFFFLHE